jgi:RHS repeat-associated protein
MDGSVGASDVTAADAVTGGHHTEGREWLSAEEVFIRKGYAGYEIENILTGSEPLTFLHHVRHRVLSSYTGRWNRRDPLGYVDGMSLFQYASAQPLSGTDPLGQMFCLCSAPALPSWLGGYGILTIDCSCINLLPIWIVPGNGDPAYSAPCCGVNIDADGYELFGTLYKMGNGCCVKLSCSMTSTGLVVTEDSCGGIISYLDGYCPPKAVSPCPFGNCLPASPPSIMRPCITPGTVPFPHSRP